MEKRTTMRLHALLALCAATAIAQAQTPPAGQVTTLSAPGGRYVFGQISESRRDQYLLDTQTGRLWVQTCISSGKEDPKQCALTGLMPVYFTDGKGDLAGLAPSSAPAR
jgi:hypothetical protein